MRTHTHNSFTHTLRQIIKKTNNYTHKFYLPDVLLRIAAISICSTSNRIKKNVLLHWFQAIFIKFLSQLCTEACQLSLLESGQG